MKKNNLILGVAVLALGSMFGTETLAGSMNWPCGSGSKEVGSYGCNKIDGNPDKLICHCGNSERDQQINPEWAGREFFKDISHEYNEEGIETKKTQDMYLADGTKIITAVDTYDDTGKHTSNYDIKYDSAGNINQVAGWNYQEGGTSIWDQKNYDKNGNLTGTYNTEVLSNNINFRYWSSGTSYDADGNKISEYRSENYEDGKTTKNYNSESYFADGSVRSSYSYEQDENGKRTHEESLNYNADGTFNNSYTRDFTYDENGRQIGYDQENFDALGNKIGTAEYHTNYDEDGNWLGNSYVEKDVDGNQTYAYNNVYEEDDEHYQTTYTEYDANGAVTNKEIDRYDYDEFGNEVWTWEQYDGAGNLLERDEDKFDDEGNYLGYTSNYYTYDENGNVIGHTMEDYTDLYDEDGNYIGQKKLAYVYDEDGNLIEESESTYQRDANGQWAWSTPVVKTYDENGNLRSVTDANGVTTRYDKNGNPIVQHKIYTVEEATRLSKPTGNKITLRYK